jgi:hypothetical protein
VLEDELHKLLKPALVLAIRGDPEAKGCRIHYRRRLEFLVDECAWTIPAVFAELAPPPVVPRPAAWLSTALDALPERRLAPVVDLEERRAENRLTGAAGYGTNLAAMSEISEAEAIDALVFAYGEDTENFAVAIDAFQRARASTPSGGELRIPR